MPTLREPGGRGAAGSARGLESDLPQGGYDVDSEYRRRTTTTSWEAGPAAAAAAARGLRGPVRQPAARAAGSWPAR